MLKRKYSEFTVGQKHLDKNRGENSNNSLVSRLKKIGSAIMMTLLLQSGVNAASLDKTEQEILKSISIEEVFRKGNFDERKAKKVKKVMEKAPLIVSDTVLYNPIEGYIYEGEIVRNVKFFSRIKDYSTFRKNFPKIIKYYEKNWGKTKDKIFIFKAKDLKNKFVILYYSGNDLKVASFVSPGKKGYRTPKRKYKSNFKEVVHFSKQYNNYPMPFSVHSGQGGIYLHVSSRVTGYSASHGCFRLAIVPARYFYNKLNKDTPIVFMGYKESF